MTNQEILSLIAVVAAAIYLVLHFSRSKKEGCAGDCSCDDKTAHKSPRKHL